MTQKVAFWILEFSIDVLLEVTYLVAVWLFYQNSPKLNIFKNEFKRSSLRSQCWMGLFGVIF